MKVVAIMIVRNEEACLPRCLEHLGQQGLTAAIIDNDSTDRTRAILEASGVVERIEHAPFDGIFRWGELLKQAHAMQLTIATDWFHLNSPDEIITSNRRGERLVDAIGRIDAEGYTVINYDEFVFLPVDEKTRGEGKAFDKMLRHYYFYAPASLQHMRSWKNVPGISNVQNGGHRLRVGRTCGSIQRTCRSAITSRSARNISGGNIATGSFPPRSWRGAGISTGRKSTPST